jgi:drug/metabolite transporter (DMT)-like permease
VALSFLMPTLYGRVLLGEILSPYQWTGVVAGVACVLAGSFQARSRGDASWSEGRLREHVVYALL